MNPIEIVYRDQNFVIVDKPSLWLTTPSRMGEKDPRPCLGLLLQAQIHQEGIAPHIYPVHRLDFEVSGLVVFALSPQAHKQANLWFETRAVKKIYHAVAGFTEKHLMRETWETKIVRGKKRSFVAAHGLEAVTEAQVVKKINNDLALWELQPLTGRPHQLRLEMSRHGFAILGDALYGSVKNWREDGSIALRAVRLGLPDKNIGNKGLIEVPSFNLSTL